jgi:hypothetical protein
VVDTASGVTHATARRLVSLTAAVASTLALALFRLRRVALAGAEAHPKHREVSLRLVGQAGASVQQRVVRTQAAATTVSKALWLALSAVLVASLAMLPPAESIPRAACVIAWTPRTSILGSAACLPSMAWDSWGVHKVWGSLMAPVFLHKEPATTMALVLLLASRQRRHLARKTR